MKQLPEFTDVLVVGAGPTGATLGAYLAGQGVDVTVIDQKERAEIYSKAGNLWPRTLEMLGGMVPGALERILPKSSTLKTLTIYAYGKHLADIPNNRYDSPYPAAVLNGQDVIEGELWGVLADNDRPVFSQAAFVAAREQPDHVAVAVEHLGQQRTVKARYVVGCDSGRSAVRQAAKLDFAPETLEKIHFLLIDATLRWNRTTDRNRMWMFFYDNGYYGIAPCWGGHHHFWSFEMVDEPLQRDPTTAEMTKRLKKLAGDDSIAMENVIWRSHITEPRTGVAPNLRAGRFFLAGDAGHVALPVGGKGMNTGIQDALALGWRLAAVLSGQASDTLLATYAEERLAVRQELKEYQLKGMYDLVDPGTFQKLGMKYMGPLLTKTMGAAGAAEFQGQKDPAMLKLSYPEGTLVADKLSGSGVKAGSRAPDATVARPGGKGVQLHALFYGSSQWTALLFDGKGDYETGKRAVRLQQSLQSLLHGQAYAVIGGAYSERASATSDPQETSLLYDLDGFAHQAFGLSSPALVLIRPDGYLGYRGPLTLKGVKQFLSRLM